MGDSDHEYLTIESMSQVLLPWLDSDEIQLNQLMRWLQGYDLPVLGSDDEPYIWLLYGLPDGAERSVRETQLAERAASLIEMSPDVHRPGKRPDQLLFNLLMLCVGLSSPEQLGEPLLDMYERRALNGHWRGVALYDALLSALIPNQIDSRLYPVWKRMLEGQEQDVLPGNEYDGFEGLLWMPKSKLTSGEPYLEAIGYALKIMTTHLESFPDRRPEFISLLDKVQDLYFDYPTWDIDLLHLAHEHQWPVWAVECLPNLSIIIGDVDPQRCHFESLETQRCKRLAVWWPFTKVLEAGVDVANFWYETEKSFCHDQVFQVVLPQNIMSFIVDLASYVEPNRIDNPFASTSSVVGNIADAMSAYELEVSVEDPLRAKILEKAHKDILEEGELVFSFGAEK